MLSQGQYEASDPCPAALVADAAPATAAGGERHASLVLHCCSFNVQTLRDSKKVLWEQFVQEGFHCVGLQETRMRTSSFIEGRDFFEFHAAASGGDGGVSLLFSKSRPYAQANGKPLRFAKHHFSCFLSSSQAIGVCVKAPFLSVTFVAAHGPHSGKSQQAISSWWRNLALQMPPRVADLLVLSDCNARLGSVTTRGVGGHAGSEECVAGTAVREFAETCNVWLPSTFSDARGQFDPHADEPTWCAPAGGLSRIDYVMLPYAWRLAHVRPRVWRDVILPREHDDHWPVTVLCRLPVVGHMPTARKPVPVRDPADLDPCAQYALDFTWRSMGEVPWRVDVHRHTQYIYDHLSTCLPMLTRHRRSRRSALASETIETVCFCRALKKHLRFLDKEVASLTLKALFRSWKACRFPDGRANVANGLGWTLLDVTCIRAICSWALASARKTLRLCAARDKASFTCTQLHRAAKAGVLGDAKALYQALRPLRPAGKRVLKPWSALAVVPAADGLVPSFQEVQDRKATFFGAIEAGVPASKEQIAEAAAQAVSRPEGFDLADLPTLLQIECLARQTPPSKAPGSRGLPNYMWTRAPLHTAKHLLPLFIKSHVRLSEPVQFKDVSLITLFKGKGDSQDLSNHRAICLLETPGKMLRKQLRPALLEALHAGDTHQGGIPGSLLQAGQHIVRTFQAIARARRLPHAAYFLDISSAYYRVIRTAFAELGESDSALLAVLHRLQVPPAYLQEVAAWANDTCLLDGTSPHVRAFIQQTLQGTHFRMQGGSFLTATQAGVRPGDSLADALFSFVQADFLRALEHDLSAQGFFEDDLLADTTLTGRLLAPTWADDTVPLVSAPSCWRLLDKVSILGSTVHRLLHCRGLRPNYSKGKTEVVAALIGPQAQACRRHLHITRADWFEFPAAEGPQQVKCVTAYTHLGGRVHARGGIMADIMQKSAAAFNAVAPLRRTVFKSKLLGAAIKRQVLASLAVSRLAFSAPTWGRLNVSETEAWRKAWTRLMRLLTNDDRWTGRPSLPDTSSVCEAAGVVLPGPFLRGERLLHFVRLARSLQDTLFQLLQLEFQHASDSWLLLLREDLHWAAELVALPSAALECFPEGLLQFVLDCPAKAQRLFKLATRRAAHECTVSNKEPEAGLFKCEHCALQFTSVHRLSVHLFASHGLRCPADAFVAGTTCPVCLRQYWTRSRVIRHLQYNSPSCLQQLLEHGMHAAPLCDNERRQLVVSGRDTAHLPACRLQGPLLPLAHRSLADVLNDAHDLLLDSSGLPGIEDAAVSFRASFFPSPAIRDALEGICEAFGVPSEALIAEC